MLVLPYRAKNPPEHFPYVTLGLMAANVFIYMATTESLLVVRESALDMFAVAHSNINPVRLLSAMFLHANPLHLLGNLLFLWIFGSAAEGRLRPLKFLSLYLLAGIVGFIAQDIVTGIANPKIPSLGASGAIMGMAGAYLYMFPFATICVVWGWGLRLRLGEWQAQWVILYFVVYDILNGMLFSGPQMSDGVAHLAHLGGAAAGFFGPMMLRMQRDSEDISNAQAIRSDAGGSFQALALHELEPMMESQPNNVELITTFLRKAMFRPEGSSYTLVFNTLQRHSRILIERGDATVLVPIILTLPPTAGTLPLPFLLKLGSRLETDGSFDLAEKLYRHACAQEPKTADTEMALLRLARLLEKTSPDRGQIASVYAEILRLFPNGTQAIHARAALQKHGPPTVAFSYGNAAADPAASPAAPSPAPVPDGLAPVASPVGAAPVPAAATAAAVPPAATPVMPGLQPMQTAPAVAGAAPAMPTLQPIPNAASSETAPLRPATPTPPAGGTLGWSGNGTGASPSDDGDVLRPIGS